MRAQPIKYRRLGWEWREQRHCLAAVGDLESLSAHDAPEMDAEVLAKFTNTNLIPQLHVAHCSTLG